MREQIVRFGADGALVGVLTRPDRNSELAGTVFLIPNSGMIHRVGPRRVSVKLARRLAEEGASSFRLDLPGVGDSGHVGGELDPRSRITSALVEAMDALTERTGATRFGIIGICSGGINGFWAAVADPRISGVLMYDGFSYSSRLSAAAYFWRRAIGLNATELVDAAARRLATVVKGRSRGQQAMSLANLDSANPPKAEFVLHVNQLVQRGCVLCFFYGGGAPKHYSYARQFADVFGKEDFFPHVSHLYRPALDHMLSTLAAQDVFIKEIVEWSDRLLSGEGQGLRNSISQIEAEAAV